jgi:hypothetical protein
MIVLLDLSLLSVTHEKEFEILKFGIS